MTVEENEVKTDPETFESKEGGADKLPPFLQKMERKPVEERYKLPENPQDFVEQIVESYPRHYDKYTLRKLISIGRITYSQAEAMTACVVNTKPYTLTFGVPFTEDNMETIEDCVYLLSHELTHLALDHFADDIQGMFKDKQLGKDAAHIIVDCQVNATCHHSLRDDKYFEFIKRYYPQDKMPQCFFRADGTPPEEYKEAHEKLYSVEGISNEELIEVLMPWFEENQDKLNEIRKELLGNHQDMGSGRTLDSDELTDIAEHIANQSQQWLDREEDKAPGPGEGEGEEQQANNPDAEGKGDGDQPMQDETKQGKQGGAGETPRERFIRTLKSQIEYSRRLRQQLNDSWTHSPQARIHKAIEDMAPKRRTRSVIPNFRDRRASSLHSAGATPLFYKRPRVGKKVVVPCYLDVSGSQDHVLPVTIPVVSRLKQIVGDEVFCFSTFISPIRINDLATGRYQTSGGTNFDPVAKHILDNHYRAAFILTDGYAHLSEHYIKELKNRNVTIKVGWTISNPDVYPLKYVAREMFYVFGDKDEY